VLWIRRKVLARTASLVRARAAVRTCNVTTLTRQPDGTSIVTTYLVPGFRLSLWLRRLNQPSEEPEVILNIDVA
jgi:hypothetical protein